MLFGRTTRFLYKTVVYKYCRPHGANFMIFNKKFLLRIDFDKVYNDQTTVSAEFEKNMFQIFF